VTFYHNSIRFDAMLYAYAILPRAGLGNMLMPWARAVAFCEFTGARMLAPCWLQLPRIGPWLRGERYKRNYNFCFSNKGYLSGIGKLTALLTKKVVDEEVWSAAMSNCVVRFSGFGGDKGFFENLNPFQRQIRDSLWKMTRRDIVASVQRLCSGPPYIGMHIRRGDFSTLGIAAPDDWYVRALRVALEKCGNIDVRVFSDSNPNGLKFIQDAFPHIRIIIMPKAHAIHDILSLSLSKFLITSPESTFSLWGAFLGQMPALFAKGSCVHGVFSEQQLADFV